MLEPDKEGLSDKGCKDEDGGALFCVEWSDNFHAEGEVATLYFFDRESAVTFSERKDKKFKGVWLSERGRYLTKRGNYVSDWFYFWWSDHVATTAYGERPSKGSGVRAGASSYKLVEYESSYDRYRALYPD
jgi:hypothetical protein